MSHIITRSQGLIKNTYNTLRSARSFDPIETKRQAGRYDMNLIGEVMENGYLQIKSPESNQEMK